MESTPRRTRKPDWNSVYC